jgi:hypothetical protein
MLMVRAFTNSKLNKISNRDLLILAAAVIVIAVIYLLASYFNYGIGFPLDDSWIHQTYARNLAQRGEWAFRPGIPSAGSTAPLWSALLAIGFTPLPTSDVFSGALTLCTGCRPEWAVRTLVDSYRQFPWVESLL